MCMYICISIYMFSFSIYSHLSIHLSFYKVFIKYCVFSLKCCDFLNSASSAAALVFYLPGVCTHIDTEGKQRKTRAVRNILKSLEKTQHLMNTLYQSIMLTLNHSLIFKLSVFFPQYVK